MPSSDLAWVAGFMEGEGTFRFDSTMRVRASQKQRWPLDKMQALCEGNIYEAKTPKGALYHIWELTGPRAEALAYRLLPLMSPSRQKQLFRAVIRRNLHMRRNSVAWSAAMSRAGKKGGYPSHKKRLTEHKETT